MKFPDCHEFSLALLEEVQEKAEREQERPGHVPDLSSTLSECAFGGYRQGWKTESQGPQPSEEGTDFALR